MTLAMRRAHCLLVAEEREGEDLLRVREALETLDGDEAVDLLEHGPETRRDVQILRLPPIGWIHFEDDGDHVFSP
jgi:hypothetical protein